MNEVLEFPSSERIKHRFIRNWCEVKAAAEEEGIQLNLDGTFTGKAAGKVEVGSDVVRITLTSKPALVPVWLIRRRLAKLFV